jgi:hypothetical protein
MEIGTAIWFTPGGVRAAAFPDRTDPEAEKRSQGNGIHLSKFRSQYAMPPQKRKKMRPNRAIFAEAREIDLLECLACRFNEANTRRNIHCRFRHFSHKKPRILLEKPRFKAGFVMR